MAERIRLLLVDDEQHVLDGLQRMFRPLRNVWEVFAANSGEQALALMAQQPIDVVVSDMRMPTMDGAELLARVQALQPKAVRIILSGQSDLERAMHRAGPCHHYLTKPCDPERIRQVVTQAWELRRFVRSPVLDAWHPDGESLPTLPQVYLGLVAELQCQDPSLLRLVALIEQDIAMSARLLHTVNSAAFGLDRQVSSIADAVALAGIGNLHSMVLALHLFAVCGRRTASGLDFVGLWQHSVAVAHLARAIVQAEHGRAVVAEAAFTAGLLHDCGQMLLASHDPAAYSKVVRGCGAGDDLSALEEANCGVRHEQAGAWLLLGWDLPDPVVEAVAWHHAPSKATLPGFTPLAAVHIADGLLHEVPRQRNGLDAGMITRLGLADRLEAWRELAQRTGI